MKLGVMLKKGQVTYLIIIAIVLLIGVAFLIYFRSSSQNVSGNIVAEDLSILKLYITQCLYDVGEEGVFNLSHYGGYYDSSSVVTLSQFPTAVYYHKGDILVPTRAELEIELENFLSDNLMECIDFEVFEEQGSKIEYGALVPDVLILDEKVMLTLQFPVSITKGTQKQDFSAYNTELKIRYGHNLDLAQKIVNKIAQNPDYRDLTFLLDTLPKIVPFLNNDELYVLNDPKSRKKDEDNYMLSFGVIYDG